MEAESQACLHMNEEDLRYHWDIHRALYADISIQPHGALTASL